MLKHIPPDYSDDDELTYCDCRDGYLVDYEKIYSHNGKHEADKCVKGWIDYNYDYFFDECGMERLIMLVAGMLFCIENGGISDDDPVDLAYNTWLAIQDFNTGEFDDLFTPEDLELLKADIKKVMDYFDRHPKLKA